MGNLLSLFKSKQNSPAVSRSISGGTARSNHGVTGRTPSYDPGMFGKPNINDTRPSKAQSGTEKQLSTQKQKYAYIPDNFTSLQQERGRKLERLGFRLKEGDDEDDTILDPSDGGRLLITR
ncbi:hypothetical protein C1H46_004387 [Malus baccata]|uniref:Uncharacterized protein n=1 Tax=Malus baccata TaxID=106549 RepID=A0A540NFZ1_MALBA|nr:hypothetical protein C1H46_004387 [Malus baccata]